MTAANDLAVRRALEMAGVEFIDENGGGPGVRLTAQLDAILAALEILPFEAPADAVYGRLRTDLERDGRPIGGNDLLIAAQATALGCTMVTDNEREFARIEGLVCENWLRPL
jgi:tRNA(fMet)-specific endonuclease VapC